MFVVVCLVDQCSAATKGVKQSTISADCLFSQGSLHAWSSALTGWTECELLLANIESERLWDEIRNKSTQVETDEVRREERLALAPHLVFSVCDLGRASHVLGFMAGLCRVGRPVF